MSLISLIASQKIGDDEVAFQELVATYRRPIYNLLLRLSGSVQDAEDLTQEVFLKAFAAYGRFRKDSSCYTWLYRIAVNSFRDHLRRKGDGHLLLYEEPQGGDCVEGQLEQKDLELTVASALLALPIPQRLVVVLHDLLGFSYKEITQIAGVSLGTVKSRLFYGREALRKILSSRSAER
ncbi:MAG: sigma-70 family RNA polymerase sigma factor [Firmicutes bacterium]|nr:sigma-70 family RNA polymerase sigma factor [Bacillota bacterium]HOB21309.1 sigma-70 family RNA polymerase sigma factor [Bacillota bacterium]HQD40192.1 sigma-70 family RNA polymerase sigma factor [Bacillota bacterium]